MPSPAWPRTPSPSARPDRQLRLEKTTFPPAGSPNKERTHGTAVRSQPLSPWGGGPTSRALCSETPRSSVRTAPRCLAPIPAPNPQTPAPKARTPLLGSKCEPWCLALIPVPPVPALYQPPCTQQSQAGPHQPLPQIPCPSWLRAPHTPKRGAQHMPASPCPQGHVSTPVLLPCQPASAQEPPPASPPCSSHTSPRIHQHQAGDNARGQGSARGRGLPSHGGHSWVAPKAGASLSPPSAARPHAWHSPVPSWGHSKSCRAPAKTPSPANSLRGHKPCCCCCDCSSSESGSGL